MSDTTNPQPQGDPEQLGDAGKKALAAERERADKAEKLAKQHEDKIAGLETQVQQMTADMESASQVAETVKKQLESEKSALELKVARLSVGIEAKLPLDLIERMQGDDEESLRADAAKLAEFVPDANPSPFPKADPSQGAKGDVGEGTNADRFASFMDAKLN